MDVAADVGLSDAELARTIDDNFRVQVVAVGHIVASGRVHVSDHAIASHSGRPSYFNRATALDARQPDLAIGEVERFFGDLPHSVWLRADGAAGPASEQVGELLAARGYVRLTPQRGMVSTGTPFEHREADPYPDLLADPDHAADVARVLASGYGYGADDRLAIEDLARAVLRHAKPFDHGAIYGVSDGGRLVTAGFLLCTPHIAGLMGIVTVPRYRDRGHATALVARAVRDAAALGYPIAGSVTTPESEALLDSLGFRAVARYDVYRRGVR